MLPHLVLDDLPYDASHLIAIELHNGVLDLDLLDARSRHRGSHPVLSNVRVEGRYVYCGAGCGTRSRGRALGRSRCLGR
jgi:hypothetical protein